jgi:competence protein ComEC
MQQKKLPSPLLVPVLLWCLGIGLAKWSGISFANWLLFSLTLILAALFINERRLYFVLLLCIALGGLRYEAARRPSQLDMVFQRQNHIQQDASFLVTKHLSRKAGIYEIRLEELAGVKVREPLLLFSESELIPGQGYSALLEVIPGKQDPVLDTYPSRHRAYIRQNLEELPQRRRILPIARWRAKLLASLDSRLGDDADYAKALLLSDTSAKGMYRDKLTRSGMIHLIVVSGLHIWFIYGMCMILLNAFLPRRLAEIVFVVLIIFYAALNHWSPPVLRALLMIGLLIISRWRSIPLGGAQLLAISLLAITLISPGQLFNVGLQLSFLCVGVIILGLPRIQWIRERHLPADKLRLALNRVLDLLLLNCVVSLAILPLTLYYFGTGSLNGIVGNLIGIPLTAAMLSVSFLVLLVPGGNFLSTAFINSYRLILRLLENWMEWVATLPLYLENTWLNNWQLAGSFVLVLSLLIVLRRLRFNWRVLPLAALGALLVFLPQAVVKTDKGVYAFNAGTADCILIRLNDGTNLMVDTGPFFYNSEKSWAVRKLLPWLKRNGAEKIDWLVITHLDSDHSGGFLDLAKAGLLENVIVTDETVADPRWLEWRETGSMNDLQIHCMTDTISFEVGGARLKFLHPDKTYFTDSTNGTSLVFRMDYLGESYLFTGDADLEAEAHLLLNYPQELDADYLKAGHHGSRTSSSHEFVRAVMPEEVWICVGDRNPWGFPHPEPLAAFQRYAKRIRSTSEGTIYLPFGQKD